MKVEERIKRAYEFTIEAFEDYEYQAPKEVQESLREFLECLFKSKQEYDFSIYGLDELIEIILDLGGETMEVYDLDKAPLEKNQRDLFEKVGIWLVPFEDDLIEYRFQSLEEAREEVEEYLIEKIEAVRSLGAEISFPEIAPLFGACDEWEGGPFTITQVACTPAYYLIYSEYPYCEPVFDYLVDF